MNIKSNRDESGHYRSLLILNELSINGSVTQRELSRQLGIALGLVNSYVKNLAAKGYVTIKSIPPKRYSYYLTPKGFAEKTRLTYHLLRDYTRIFRETRGNLKTLFKEFSDKGAKRLVFAGADEVAEIAYITLRETGLDLVAVVDDELAGNDFFGNNVMPLESLHKMECDLVIVTSYLKRNEIYRELLKNGVDNGSIRAVFPL